MVFKKTFFVLMLLVFLVCAQVAQAGVSLSPQNAFSGWISGDGSWSVPTGETFVSLTFWIHGPAENNPYDTGVQASANNDGTWWATVSGFDAGTYDIHISLITMDGSSNLHTYTSYYVGFPVQ